MTIKSFSLFWLFHSIKYYLCNHLIAYCPFEKCRHIYYRKIMKIGIGEDSHVSMGQFITGFYKKPAISIGKNTVINRRCYIDGRIGVTIGDNCNISFGVTFISLQHNAQSPSFACTGNPIIIENNVWLGANSIIMPGVTIGNGSVIGAGAVVTKSIPPFSIAVGVPAKVIKSRNKNINYLTSFHPYADTDIFDESPNFK